MLKLRSRPDYPNSYLVMTAWATAGVISYIPHQHTWYWSITAFNVCAHPPFKGMQTSAATREEAMKNFAVEWRRWVAYCGPKEIEEVVDTEVHDQIRRSPNRDRRSIHDGRPPSNCPGMLPGEPSAECALESFDNFDDPPSLRVYDDPAIVHHRVAKGVELGHLVDDDSVWQLGAHYDLALHHH
jgi:hypothetical protein